MKLFTKYMTRNDCYTAGRKITPKGIMVHSTAVPGVMAAEWFSRWNKSYKAGEINRQVCVHAFVDDKEVWQYLLSIAENSKWAIRRRFQNGTYKIAYPPYGYDYMDGKLFINKEQAEIVKRIFSEALAGKGTQKIADGLNLDKIPTKRGLV